MERLELSLAQSYEIEKMGRAIDEEESIDKLKSVCKTLVRAWMIQKSAVSWIMRQKGKPTPVIHFETDS